MHVWLYVVMSILLDHVQIETCASFVKLCDERVIVFSQLWYQHFV